MEGFAATRPNRSDVHLDMDQEAMIEQQTRLYFDGLAPQRHSKPSRSEYSALYQDSNGSLSPNHPIPEFLHFQSLEAYSHEKIICQGKEAGEEFVETEYYKDLNSIDKLHHTTGTGFIKMEGANGKCFSLAPEEADTLSSCHSCSCRGNPATNDWIPAAPAYLDTSASNKPKRSEN